MILVILSAILAGAEGAPMTLKPALNDPPAQVSIGARPYEMEGREEGRAPLVDFEDLRGWTVECSNGAVADLIRTCEQQMYGRYVAKLEYRGGSPESSVIIRPPSPVSIGAEFDCANMWIHGNTWEWAPEPGTPFVEVSILVTDSAGKEREHGLTRVRWKEWWLAHRKLESSISGASFSGIKVSGLSNSEDRSIFMDSLAFYREELPPLAFEPRPARNLTLFPGQGQGLNGTGPGRLPFPTREETILPTNFASTYRNAISETSPGCYELRYRARDCSVRYVYQPLAGDLGEITAYVGGRKTCIPMRGGGIQLGGESAATGKLTSCGIEDGAVRAVFDLGGATAEYRLRIWQKSLVIDFICRGGEATGLLLGEVAEIENPKLVLIPYLTFGASNPRVVCFGDPKSPRFASAWVDWYRSNGSELYSREWAQEKSAKVNGGVRYVAKTDGRRNDLYERVFFTVSPTFEETLPTIANPASPHGEEAGERLWQESWGPDDYAKQHKRSKTLRSYGIEKLTQCNHEITWRDGGESFTLRTKAAPKKGGDEALAKYVADQGSLGWLSGLYTNYTDFAPVNEHWDEDYVQRTPSGEWRPAWPRCYALKSSRAVELDAKLAPEVQRKFGSNAAYTDVQTAVSPWAYCDYDARVPGAGTFAATFYAYGELLLHDQRVYGPTWSEGTYQCLYAGLATGNYGLAYTGVDLAQEPLNVAFDLMTIHPLECDIGMPWTGHFLKGEDWKTPERIDESIDHFLAATIAYGHIGWLVEEEHGIQRTCRSYYMLQQLQKRYCMKRPDEIAYADLTGKWLTASQAIASGEMRHSRLRVKYPGGLQVYVNGSREDWEIGGVDGKAVTLPPWGWYAFEKNTGFVELSGVMDRHRMDYVRSAEYEYLDGRSTRTCVGGLSAKGAIAVRRRDGMVEIIDIYGNDRIGFRGPERGLCTAYDADGKSLGVVNLRFAQDGMAWLQVMPNARLYRFDPSRSPQALGSLSLGSSRDSVVPGDEIVVQARFAPNRAMSVRSATIEVEGGQKVEVPEWSGRRVQAGSEQMTSVRVAVPESIPFGEIAFVKVRVEADDGQSAQSWLALDMVPAFEIGVKPIGEGRFRIDVQNNLQGSPEPEVDVSLKPGDTGIRIAKYEKRERTVVLTPPPATKEVSGQMVVQVTTRTRVVTREFRVSTVVERPVVWRASSDEAFVWGCAVRGSGEMTADTSTGASFIYTQIPCGGVTKPGIFSHPPYTAGVGYTYGITRQIAIPNDDCEFRGFIGIKDGGATSDGVTFKVLALDEAGDSHDLISEHWANREWKEIVGDLSRFRGQKIRLKFIADVGPDNDSTADWASWGEPRIVLKQPRVRIEVGR